MNATNNIAVKAMNTPNTDKLMPLNVENLDNDAENRRITAMLGAAAAPKTVSTVPVESQRCGLIAIVG
ncbi:MAG: hypothetical protein RL761_628, partial [Pseudomonadota bacterium]